MLFPRCQPFADQAIVFSRSLRTAVATEPKSLACDADAGVPSLGVKAGLGVQVVGPTSHDRYLLEAETVKR